MYSHSVNGCCPVYRARCGGVIVTVSFVCDRLKQFVAVIVRNFTITSLDLVVRFIVS